jgi:hypothetical protein
MKILLATREVLSSKTTKILIALAALSISAYYCSQHAHIESIEMSRFRAHRGDYEMPLAMLKHDNNLTFVNEGLTSPDDPATIGISPARIAEYRRILSRLGRGSLNYVPGSGSALFVADSMGDDNILFFPIRASAFAAAYGPPFGTPPAQAHHIDDDWYLSSERF